MGRIRDMIRTLLGRSEPQIELARMRAEFAGLMLDVSNAMEKLKTATLKLARRDSRALEAALTEEVEAIQPPQDNKWSRRAAVMKRRSAPVPVQPEVKDERSDQERTG